uniref:Fatty acyl-CoA reductase n=1 Tax=Sipha flava TaxID=143950 RepID=A0A2S2RAC3_9HEMI
MEKSIAETFRNGTLLVTGSTGFLGKILIEKILRSCPVKTIVIIVRNKNGISPQQRVAYLYEQSIFNRLRKEKPDFMNNIKVIDGDLEKTTISSPDDYQWMIENVDFIFHCAATIKFNEPVESACKINIQGTERILTLATKMKNLKGFVHVSTAYSHCPRDEIKEQYYPTPITSAELQNMISSDKLPSNIVGNWPNTYTFTKSIVENSIATNYGHLPISIFRPSIIGCSVAEPEPGWTDNTNGATGLIASKIAGVLRTIQLDTSKITDIIPIDYTANALICTMWDTVKRYQDPNAFYEEPKIYNYVSSCESAVTWNMMLIYVNEVIKYYPPLTSMWYNFCIFSTNFWIVMILKLLLHRIPAALVDLSLFICGKKPRMLKMYEKLELSIDMVKVFTMREWKFDNINTRKMWSSLRPEDRKTFYYSFEGFDWNSYMNIYFHGIRKHILKEDLNNIETALAKHKKLFWYHHLSIVLIVCLVVHICWMSR